MNRIAFLLSVVLLGATEEIPTSFLDPVTKLSATAGLVAVVLIMSTRTLPAMSKGWREDTEVWRITLVGMEAQRHQDEIARNERTERLTAALSSLEKHCQRLERADK